MTTTVDVLVIGGGATGAAAAYDAARRGLRVLLVEQGDLTSGTSGRYHGLLHSGGRYAVRDIETARECIDENTILRRIVPFAIEDTGGLFVATPADPPGFAAQWVAACAQAGIRTEALTPEQARAEEPGLTPDLTAAYRVPDGTCDSFDLIHAFAEAARALGGEVLTYHRVVALLREGDTVTGARLADTRSGAVQTVQAACVLNAGGAWAGEVAHLAKLDVRVLFDRGAMVAMNMRWTNTVINRLRPPTDGDILVPVGTVCVLGTTSVQTDFPGDTRIEPWEISRILAEADALIPGIRQGRALRAWAGVRPLYEPPETHHTDAAGRALKRTFSVIDHLHRDGVRGLITVTGGKLTTCRLMAEQAVDAVCGQLGLAARGTTAGEPLPGPQARRHHHRLQDRLRKLEHGEMPGDLICECEMVTRPQLDAAIAAYGDRPVALDDLRRDLRLGMGPCQAGFCGYRAAAIVQQTQDRASAETTDALAAFVDERFKGVRPLLWGHQLRQLYLDELIYRRTLGLDQLTAPSHAHPTEEPADVPLD